MRCPDLGRLRMALHDRVAHQGVHFIDKQLDEFRFESSRSEFVGGLSIEGELRELKSSLLFRFQ